MTDHKIKKRNIQFMPVRTKDNVSCGTKKEQTQKYGSELQRNTVSCNAVCTTAFGELFSVISVGIGGHVTRHIAGLKRLIPKWYMKSILK